MGVASRKQDIIKAAASRVCGLKQVGLNTGKKAACNLTTQAGQGQHRDSTGTASQANPVPRLSLTQHQQLHRVLVLALQVVGGGDDAVIEPTVAPHELSNLKICICHHEKKDPVLKLCPQKEKH